MEPIKRQTLWHPVSFSNKWLECSTTKLDILIPSWEIRRKELQSKENEYCSFVENLKRLHAIETGVIERLYIK